MAFADMKNDFAFRRIFALHPELLRGLLDDLLERTGDREIESLEYLPTTQLPLVQGARLSILDARCKDRAGTSFMVAIRLIHLDGYIKRAVYDGCKAYADHLAAGAPSTDVVAISICDFELWPDAEQDQENLPRVPMLSHWYTTEHSRRAEPDSGTHKLLQVEYVVLELPKLPKHKPDTGPLQWAWLFVHARELTEVPPDLLPGPYREALALANLATFRQTELDAYQRVIFEIQQTRDYGAEQRAAGRLAGKLQAAAVLAGIAEGKAAAILTVLSVRGVPVSQDARARIEACKDLAMIDRWISRAATAASTEEVFATASERA